MSNRFDKSQFVARKSANCGAVGAIVLSAGILLAGCGDASGGRHTGFVLDETSLKQIYYPPLDRIATEPTAAEGWPGKGAVDEIFDGLAYTAEGEVFLELHHRSGLSELVSSNLRKRGIRLISVVPSLDKMTIGVKNVKQLRQIVQVNGVTLLVPAKALPEVQR